jgi:Zn-dependent membrane protease YugP
MPTSTILYFIGVLVALISIVISANVNSKFNKWSKSENRRRITGCEVAERMLRLAGINDVSVCHVRGNLTDHYDPRRKTVNLSDGVYGKATIAAVAVAAHECGHAIQHNKGYVPLSLRSMLVPVANFGSNFGAIIFMAGLLFAYFGAQTLFLLDIGIALFAFAVLFHIITLPVEFNASRRALTALRESNLLSDDEIPGARKVLSAAALTYVAAAASAAIQLLRLIAIRNRD